MAYTSVCTRDARRCITVYQSVVFANVAWESEGAGTNCRKFRQLVVGA